MDANLTQLLNRLGTGGRQHFDTAYRLVIEGIKRIARRRKRKSGICVETTEIADDAMLRIGLNGKTPHFASRGKFYAYSERVVANLLLDQIRKQRAGRRIPPEERQSLDAAGPVASRVECDAAVVELVDDLDAAHPQLGLVFQKHALEQKSLEEIAGELGKQEHEIEAMWKTAIALIRRRLTNSKLSASRTT